MTRLLTSKVKTRLAQLLEETPYLLSIPGMRELL